MFKKTSLCFLLSLLLFAVPAPASTVIKLEEVAFLSDYAQEAIWLNEKEIAVGRWDGITTIFHNEGRELTPHQALISPSKQGVTMLAKLSDTAFASSNGKESIVVYEKTSDEFCLKSCYNYPPYVGEANSATLSISGGEPFLVTGHAEGVILVWKVTQNALELVRLVPLRSPHPIKSPFHLKNIRGVTPWRPGLVLTGSEDGDICLVDISTGKILQRQCYNESAQRGINALFCLDNYVLVGNCADGAADKNLWLYAVQETGFALLDSINLVHNTALPQVFTFDVKLFHPDQASYYFFCTTGEGLLWYGSIVSDKLNTIDCVEIAPVGGAALAIHPTQPRLAAIAYDNYLFDLVISIDKLKQLATRPVTPIPLAKNLTRDSTAQGNPQQLGEDFFRSLMQLLKK